MTLKTRFLQLSSAFGWTFFLLHMIVLVIILSAIGRLRRPDIIQEVFRLLDIVVNKIIIVIVK